MTGLGRAELDRARRQRNVDVRPSHQGTPIGKQLHCDLGAGAGVRSRLPDGFTDVATMHPLPESDAVVSTTRRVDCRSRRLIAGHQLGDNVAQGPGLALVNVPLVVIRRKSMELPADRRGQGRRAVSEHISY